METHTTTVRVPLLATGRHLEPTGGVGLLELVSLLSDSPWTDRPAGVHPALAQVADSVNGLVRPHRARMLVPFAPWLAGTNSARPAVAASIALACTNAALPHADQGGAARLLRAIDGAGAVLSGSDDPRGRWAGPRESLRVADQVRRAVRIVADAHESGRDRDRALMELLEKCLNAARGAHGSAAVHPRLPLAACPDHIDLRIGRAYHPHTGELIPTYRPADPAWQHRLVVASWSAGRI